MKTPPPAIEPSDAARAVLLLPVLRNSAESWGNHHCAGELRRAIALVESLLGLVERLKLSTFMVGRSMPTEDDLIQQGVNFGDYERGVNAAVDVIARRIARCCSRTPEIDAQSAGSSPDITEVMAHGVFVYEVDYGPDDKWRGVRLEDFNRVVSKLSASPAAAVGGHTVGEVITANDGRKFKFLGYGNYEELPSKTAFVHGPAAPVVGFVVVPSKIHVDADAWESASLAFGGPATGEGEAYMDCTLWIGEQERDDGSKVHGMHVSCNECPEEGSITLAEFTSPTAQPSAKDGVDVDAFREGVARQWLESKASEECRLPPDGRHCTRGAGHDGPCASVPNEDLRSCTICGLTVDVSKGHVAPSSDFTMQGRTKPKATTASGLVDDAMVERAMKAGQEYWDSPDQVASCNECDGTGKVPSGDSQDWCGTCDGGVINTGTEEGAMRAALQSVWPGQKGEMK